MGKGRKKVGEREGENKGNGKVGRT